MEERIKCFKCRHTLLDNLQSLAVNKCDTSLCETYTKRNFLYLSEDRLPAWINSKVEQERWTKGKLHCENCGYKVGSFDFVSGKKCDCGGSVVPSVHLVSRQVDKPPRLS